MGKTWDVFISHASEDKDAIARPLATALVGLGVRVWFDELSIEIGDSLRRSIDRGLADSSYGVVILSPAFLQKSWPQHELDGLVARQIEEGEVILPVWFNVTRADVLRFSPPLADKLAATATANDPSSVVRKLLQKIRPDLYRQLPPEALSAIAATEDVAKLKVAIRALHERLEPFICPICGAPATAIGAEPNEYGDSPYVTYECGAADFDGSERPCPSASDFPRFEDLAVEVSQKAGGSLWYARARPAGKYERSMTFNAKGNTQEMAERLLRAEYDRCAKPWRP